MYLSYIDENDRIKRVKYAKEVHIGRPFKENDLVILKEKSVGLDMTLGEELYNQLPLNEETHEAKMVLDVLNYIREKRIFKKTKRLIKLRRYL